MLNTKKGLVLLVFLLLALVACNKEEDSESKSSINLNIPPYLNSGYNKTKVDELDVSVIELGKFLFFDKILSRDSSVSCASCHKPQKAFTDGKAKSIGIDGQVLDRSAMSLANLLWRKKLMWDGRFESLEAQALDPISNEEEMDLPIDQAIQRLSESDRYAILFEKAFGSSEVTSEKMAKAFAQFERTLISANSKYDQHLQAKYSPTSQELRGLKLFFTHPEPENGVRGGNCGDCHGGFLQLDQSFHNNGLDTTISDKGRGAITGFSFDVGRFKTPSLRNIALTAPYMHDGRFSTLEEVMDHYNEHVQLNSPGLDPLIAVASNQLGANSLSLTAQEKEDIIAFLQMLTDNDFIINEKFTNPFN